MKHKLFMMSLASVLTVPAVFAGVPIQTEAASNVQTKSFKDVPAAHTYHKEISEMATNGVINGYTDGTFKPVQAISRVHVALLLERAVDLKPVRAGKEFKDVPKNHIYYKEIQKVYRAGIFDGKEDGTFGVMDNLTRAHMSKVLVNAFNLKNHEGYIFDDITAEHWAKDYIASLYMSGITTGNDGKYKPNDSVSRAHYAVFLHRALNPDKTAKPDKPLQPTPPVVEKPTPKPPVVEKPTPKPPVVEKPTPKPPVEEKPTPKPPVVEKPTPKPPVEEKPGFKVPVIGHDVAPGAVPRPPGYVESTHDKNNKLEQEKKIAEQKHGFNTGLNLRTDKSTDAEKSEDIDLRADMLGVSREELIRILDWTITTGEMYDGGKFVVYYRYESGTFAMSGVRDW